MTKIDEQRPESLVILVHGVGPFDDEQQLNAVGELLRSTQETSSRLFEVTAFNWREEVPSVFGAGWLRMRPLAAIGAAMVNVVASRLGSPEGARHLVGLYIGTSALLPFAIAMQLLVLGGNRLVARYAASEERSARSSYSLRLAIVRLGNDQRALRGRPPFVPAPYDSPVAAKPRASWGRVAGHSAYVFLAVWALSTLYVIVLMFAAPKTHLAAHVAAAMLPLVWTFITSFLTLPLIFLRNFLARWRRYGAFVGTPLGLLAASLASQWIYDIVYVRAGTIGFALAFVGIMFGVIFAARWLSHRAAAIVARMASTPSMWIAMVLSDVLRYLGDDAYRTELHTKFSERLRDCGVGDNRDVIIVSHSLGSVIAVDHLRFVPEDFGGARQITLITMGSPLRRLIMPVMPDRYANCVQLERSIGALVARFRWINIYRPLDPIGGAIFRRPSGDFSTHQWRRGHTGYWTDPVVLKTISDALSITAFTPGVTTSSMFPSWFEADAAGQAVFPQQWRKMLERAAETALAVAPVIFVTSLPLFYAWPLQAKIVAPVGWATAVVSSWSRLWRPYFAATLGITQSSLRDR